MNIKQIETLAAIFLGCALGSIILQFAAPILLAILVSGASLTVPFLIYHLFVRKGWKIRLEREKNSSVIQKEVGTENTWGKPEETDRQKVSEQNHVNERDENDSESEEEEAAMLWYNESGRSRLDEIVQTAEALPNAGFAAMAYAATEPQRGSCESGYFMDILEDYQRLLPDLCVKTD